MIDAGAAIFPHPNTRHKVGGRVGSLRPLHEPSFPIKKGSLRRLPADARYRRRAEARPVYNGAGLSASLATTSRPVAFPKHINSGLPVSPPHTVRRRRIGRSIMVAFRGAKSVTTFGSF